MKNYILKYIFMMESQKVRKCHRIAFMADAKLSNIAAFIKIPACAGMTTYTFCKFVIISLTVFMLIAACQSEEDILQKGYWVENDAENSLVKFSEDGRFLNIRNPEIKIRYEFDGSDIIFKSKDDSYRLKIKSASDMAVVLANNDEEFTFFRANPSDYFFGIWQGKGQSHNIEFTFAEKNNGYLTIIEDTSKHVEFFTYQLVNSEMIIYKQDKRIDTVIFDFSDDLTNLSLQNKNNSKISLKRADKE
jgi:hypothetical protein